MPVRTPFYEVKVEGQDITPWVSSVTVVEDDRQADHCTVVIPDPRMIYTDGLFEGSVAEIDVGYAEPNQHALMLRATLSKVEVSYPESGVATLTLKGEDRSIMMGLEEKKRLWKGRTVTGIVREVARPYNFHRVEAQLDKDPMIKSKPINQDGKTDLAFLQDLAKKYHAKCFVELDEEAREVLYFIPERRVVRLNRPEQLVLRYRLGPGSNLVSFSPSFDASYIDRLKEISDIDKRGKKIDNEKKEPDDVVLWDLDPGRMAQANERDRERIRALYEAGAAKKRELHRKLAARKPEVGLVAPDQAELDADNDSLESRKLGMSATGSTFGNIWLRAKSKVTIDGVGSRWSGEWYVSQVTHRIDSNGYKSDFKCVR